ncbi:glycosyltransferase family 2 protein [Filimonas effusa]|nr:glycosyltransferase family A protein [Filimonas effusa]
MSDLVSVVVVTYKRLEYLRQTVESILRQSYYNLEVIVVGDGMEEDVAEYITSLNNRRINYYWVEHCGYPAKARNFGIQKALGQYIAFCDDDDLWYPDKIAKQVAILDGCPGLLLCCSLRNTIDGKGNRIANNVNWIPKKLSLRSLLLTNYITYSSVVIRGGILNKVGFFPDTVTFKAVEDYHLWLRIVNKGDVFMIKEALVEYRIHNSNITANLFWGTKLTLLVLNDFFKNHSVSYSTKMVALMVIYLKRIYYKIKYSYPLG